MTRKHFIALADMLVQLHKDISQSENYANSTMRASRFEQWLYTQNAIADFCASQNSHFDRARWLKYIADHAARLA